MNRQPAAVMALVVRPARPLLPFLFPLLSSRGFKSKGPPRRRPENPRAVKQPSPASGGGQVRPANSIALLDTLQNMVGMVAPLTIVAPPITRMPRSPRDFFTYLWKNIRWKTLDFGGYMSIRMSSKGRLMSPPRFRLEKKGILPTAKALHRTFSEAVAAGDTGMLRKITTDNVYNKFSDVIWRRSKRTQYGWELVKYNSPWRLPRVASHRIMPLPKNRMVQVDAAVHQVVITIASRQRLIETEEPLKRRRADGDDVPAEPAVEKRAKEVDLTEHVVLTRVFDTKTYAATDWKLAGTVGETSLRTILEDEAYIKSMDNDAMAKHKV